MSERDAVCGAAGGHTGGGVQILSIIPPDEFQHWMGVAELMRAEARERIEAHFEVFAKWMRDKQGVNPELVIREGDPVAEILAQVKDDPRSACWCWVRGPTRPGPARWSPRCPATRAACRSPITIVPGDMTQERLESIT